jgi:hypothetical protein
MLLRNLDFPARDDLIKVPNGHRFATERAAQAGSLAPVGARAPPERGALTITVI